MNIYIPHILLLCSIEVNETIRSYSAYTGRFKATSQGSRTRA